MGPQTERADGQDVIPAGQEELVRAMVAPPLPGGWLFVQARVRRAEIHARYVHPGPPRVHAELRLAGAPGDGGGGRFRARLAASGAAPELAALREALLASVRAREADVRWARDARPEPAVVAPASEPPPPPPEPPAVLREARARFDRGAFDDALGLLARFADGAPPPEAEAALALRAGLMWELGRDPEALAALDAALGRLPDSVALHAAAATWRSELYDPRAADHARAVLALVGGASGLGLRAASVLLALGHEGEARAAVDRVLAASPGASAPLLRDVARLREGAGDYDDAAALYDRALALDPSDVGARVAAGTLRAWRGDADGALAHAEAALARDAECAPALCLRGAARMLAGEVPAALGDLDRAGALDPDDPVAPVWRGEALLRLGRHGEAAAEARRGGELSDDITHHVAAQVVVSLAQVRGGVFPGMPEHVLREALATLEREALAPADGGAARAGRSEREARFEGALARLRGNRSPVATYLRPGGALTRLAVPASPRVRAKRALWRFVAAGDPAPAMAEFDRIHADAPRAAEPYNYRGEVFLYLGDAAAAAREFERAIALYRQSRWAYIGLAGAAVVAGDFRGALDRLAEGVARAGAPGPTTYVYRGEALRRLGRLDEAREDLDRAVRLHPGRIGAWVNLALLDAARGDPDGAASHLGTLRRRARGLAADASAALGLDPDGAPSGGALEGLCEEMLAMLRGNRGSSCVTYFTRAGQLRTVPPPRPALW